jgi:hypothetical protein
MKTKDVRQFFRRVDQINVFAQQEGWLMCNAAVSGFVEIQRDDEQATFPNDAAAVRHIRRLAANGSALHKMALQMVEDAQKEGA